MLDYLRLNGVDLLTASRGVSAVEGLSGAPAVRADSVALPTNDGSVYASDRTLGERVITVTGYVTGTSANATRLELAALAAACHAANTAPVLLTWRWTGDTVARQASVICIQPPAATLEPGPRLLGYELIVAAPDPLNYNATPVSATRTGTGVLAITPGGEANTWPTITLAVSATVTDPALAHPSLGTLTFTGLTLTVGQTLTVVTHPAARAAAVAGASVMGKVAWSSSRFFALTPAAQNLTFTAGGAGAASAVLTVTASPAYLS